MDGCFYIHFYVFCFEVVCRVAALFLGFSKVLNIIYPNKYIVYKNIFVQLFCTKGVQYRREQVLQRKREFKKQLAWAQACLQIYLLCVGIVGLFQACCSPYIVVYECRLPAFLAIRHRKVGEKAVAYALV